MNLAHWLARQAVVRGASPALFLGTSCVSDYATFDRKAQNVAVWLLSEGVGVGDRVAIYMGNTPDYLIGLYGIWYAGAVAVPVNAKLHPREVAFILENSNASIVLSEGNYLDALADVSCQAVATSGISVEEAGTFNIVERAADDLAWLFYTSGTTGQPKGVEITHGMLMSMALCYASDVDTVSPDDATLYAAPMSHGAGIYALMHVQQGARHVCPVSGGFDPVEIFELAAHFGRMHMFAAPTMVKRMTDVARASGKKGEGLRRVIYAGGPMYLADLETAREQFGDVFAQVYGQGECPMGITALRREDIVSGDESRRLSVGRAQSAVEVRIADESGAAVPTGEVGEVTVRGATVMPGYWRNPAATADALQNGWLRTGDIGSLDLAGYLTLRDRSKDVIISGGSNVYPREVEEVLLTHPKVDEVAVVGRPHPDWGEEVVAVFVGEAEDGALDRLCRDNIARFKAPKSYLRVSALPKNNYGKVLKTELRKLV